MPQFIVARNPNLHSRLPFLVCLPLDDGELWLQAKADWPRACRVYCHPVSETPAVEQLNILQRIDVMLCQRRGPAIDLVLARGINKRAQFVFTSSRGRPIILWQTAKAAKAARPGVRIPVGKPSREYIVYVDTRERYGYSFAAQGGRVESRHLLVGDYATLNGDRVVGVVERKRFDDFANSLVTGSLNFAMAELVSAPVAAIAVEGTYTMLLRHRYTPAGFLPELLARLQVRYPQVSINFLESRKIAEEWTYRFLRAAHGSAETRES